MISTMKEKPGAMFGTLTVSPVKWDALEEADFNASRKPWMKLTLVNFLCHVACEECGQQNEFGIDLCDAALSVLHRIQKQMIVMVHRLRHTILERERNICSSALAAD